MTEQTAFNKGLIFTGIVSDNKEKVKKQIKEERQKRKFAKIYLVTKRVSKYSMSCPGSLYYTAYANEAYFAYNILEDANKIIDNHYSKIQQLKEEYENKVKQAEMKYDQAQNKRKFAMSIIHNEMLKRVTKNDR